MQVCLHTLRLRKTTTMGTANGPVNVPSMMYWTDVFFEMRLSAELTRRGPYLQAACSILHKYHRITSVLISLVCCGNNPKRTPPLYWLLDQTQWRYAPESVDQLKAHGPVNPCALCPKKGMALGKMNKPNSLHWLFLRHFPVRCDQSSHSSTANLDTYLTMTG